MITRTIHYVASYLPWSELQMGSVRDGLQVAGEIIAFSKAKIIAAITWRIEMYPRIEKRQLMRAGNELLA